MRMGTNGRLKMMTKKNYIGIVKAIIKSNINNIKNMDTLVDNLCEYFKKDNPNFNEDVFRKAIMEE